MWQKIILQSQRNRNLPDQGFLTLEIIIATLVAFAFLMFSLQALVLGMYLKVQAQEDQRADQLIQEDIERVSSLGNTLSTGDCDAATYNDGYARELWDDLIAAAPTVTTSLLTANSGEASGTTLTLNRTHVSYTNNTAPFRSLRIYYQVQNNDNDIIASRYLEIIPDEALQCP